MHQTKPQAGQCSLCARRHERTVGMTKENIINSALAEGWVFVNYRGDSANPYGPSWGVDGVYCPRCWQEKEQRRIERERAEEELAEHGPSVLPKDLDIVTLHKAGKSQGEIARELYMNEGTVRQRLLRRGLVPPGPSLYEIQERKTARDRQAILWWREGLRHKEIGTRLGVTRGRSQQILTRALRYFACRDTGDLGDYSRHILAAVDRLPADSLPLASSPFPPPTP